MRIAIRLAFPALAGLLALSAQAQSTYPNRPITLVVPFAAGGAFDVVARLTAKEVGKELNQSVVVDNKPGAGGVLGGKLVGLAKPDGYTILLSGVGPISIAPAVYRKMDYSPSKVLAPVIQLTSSPFVLATSTQFKGNSVQDFVGYLKASPNAYNYASTGNGTLVHLAGEYFKTRTGTEFVHVPFTGGAPATTSMLAGETLFSITNIPNVRSQIEAGKLKGLATTGLKRSAAFPQLPTVSEAGIAQFDLTGWIGIFVPAGTPAPVIARLQAAYDKAMRNPELKERLNQQGDEVATGSTSEFAEFLSKNERQWRDIAATAKITLD
ncbi:tripartite tricarboxylate transporter substrate binding protein [Diaphorobacter ruginosibacter]|uniref:Tripartite tricarboxylate transporter substrate binding protein n=1 Tax=Diaphorobacter ruginosibacter TaxID=1715720 RepID=A0A7G9RSX3_9BURK|nr:tripartite tricarboxylate transporter substrate binding protein [Diaphorobacter ruginosibacter]QNN58698.1 tripartite tricarboxylate transporter substrate binding protein [Diaphorobacter ruginosibacter]